MLITENGENFDPIPTDSTNSTLTEEGFRAVRTNVPSTFHKALQHPEWGEPARAEFNTIFLDMRSVVEIPDEIAQLHLQNGAEMLKFMPAVYEEKVREGKIVRKVRLVLNGKQHNIHG